MRFVAESRIRASPERVFAFHELPDALERLTPPWAGSRVIAHAPSLTVGSRTVCDIRVAPLVWVRTELVHTACERPRMFVDEQVRGPFRSWRHQHIVIPANDDARLTDIIDVEPPFGLLGRALAPLLIRPRLRKLFAYRHDVTRSWCQTPVSSEP
ncbi:MAG TPA: SRPBCC family protein [Thermoanaerobaculia bacterium]|nr:SRPBCC family protein [Thermoanaerobaculia bacterium]